VRFAEFALFLVPLLTFVLWRRMAARATGLPSWALVAIVVALASVGALLVALALIEGAPPGAVYVPPHMEDGRVVPGHWRV